LAIPLGIIAIILIALFVNKCVLSPSNENGEKIQDQASTNQMK
jgi:hypothetical protein